MERDKILSRERRKKRIKKKLRKDFTLPRLCVFKSNRYIYAQLVDDRGGKTLTCASSLEKDLKKGFSAKKVSMAKEVGKRLGERARKLGIKKIVFDRSGYPYQGRVKALAEGAREAGLEF